jgi:hypothetical protein
MTPKNGQNPLDFSEAAAKRAALSEVIQHPLTLWPPAVGMATAFGLGLFGIVTAPVAMGIAAGGLIVGAAHWATRYLGGSDVYMQKYYAKLHEEFDEMKKEKSAKLATDLKKLGCERGQIQVDQFEEKFRNLIEVFRRVVSEQELTFSRFVGTAERVYKSSLDNLDRIVTMLLNIDDIDRDDIGKRIASLKRKATRTPADERSIAALQEQAGVYDSTQQEVDELLARNEEALATLDKAGNAAVRLQDRTSSQTPQETLADAMELLNNMIARASQKLTPAIVLEQELKH